MSAGAPAAHIDDKLTHTGAVLAKPIGSSVGMGVGLVIGIAAILVSVPTGPAGWVAAVCGTIALANDGAQLGGKWAGWAGEAAFPEIGSGNVLEGATTVFLGAEKKKHARIEDSVNCTSGAAMEMAGTAVGLALNPSGILLLGPALATSMLGQGGHMGAKIAEGVKFIYVEGRTAARYGCQTTCGAKISSGDETVILCGDELERLFGFPDKGKISETQGLDETLGVADWVGSVAAVIGAAALLLAGVTFVGIVGFGGSVGSLIAKLLGYGYAEDTAGLGGAPGPFKDLARFARVYERVKRIPGATPKLIALIAIAASSAGIPGAKVLTRAIEGTPDEESGPKVTIVPHTKK